MDEVREVKEFDVLGYKIRLKSDQDTGAVAPQEIVDFFQSEIDQIRSQAPGLAEGQLSVLAALNITKKYLELDKEFEMAVKKMNSTAQDALSYIEQVSPSTL